MLRRSILAGLLASPAFAQTPERGLRLIIAFPPGGSTDILGRLVAPRMGEVLGALVTEGKEIPEGSLVMGAPAKVIRALDAETRQRLLGSAAHYVENALRFAKGLRRL